jgi:3-phosphoshikimate 1-carboxyvinyltransferase
MQKMIITSSTLSGSISVPPSKSHTMRAILFGALAEGTSVIRNVLSSPDTDHMIHACKLLGAKCDLKPDCLTIEGLNGKIERVEDVIQCGNSGIILRFLSSISALCPSYVTLTGDHSIRHQRPMHHLLDALNQLGVFAVSACGDGFAPLIIRGPLKGGKVTLQGEDSQPVSSLLIACSLAEGPTEIIARNPGEKPWVSLTLSWLDRLGIDYVNENFERYKLEGNGHFKAFEYAVPGDWSSAAFPIAAALITNSSLTLENVDMFDPQGDKDLVEILRKMGALIEIDEKKKTLHVKAGKKLKGIAVDINHFIDAVTILAVIACYAEGETHILNASIARQKECDRLHAITIELTKMGASIIELSDGLLIRGKPLHGALVNSWGDHRMAMSLAVAGLGAEGSTTVENVDCIGKTFPHFVESFKDLGAIIEVEEA